MRKSPKGRPTEDIESLKAKYLAYYEGMPIHNLACGWILRDPSTVNKWRKKDKAFNMALERAKAQYVMNENKQIRSREWVLERTVRDHFAPPTSSVDVTSQGEQIVWDMGAVMGIKRGRKPRK